jgi:hypothetical protein
MTFREFCNGLRMLRSIDSSELHDLPWYPEFNKDPYRFLITCADETAARIWIVMLKRGVAEK